MPKRYSPSIFLCGCAGSLIGAVSAALIASAGLLSRPDTPQTLLSISSLTPDTLHVETDIAKWTGNITGVLRAAMGLAVETVSIQKGDTLANVLVDSGLDNTTTFKVTQAIHKIFNLRHLREGQKLELAYEPLGTNGEATTLSKINMEISPGHLVSVSRQVDGSFAAHEIIAETYSKFSRVTGTISSSLYEAAEAEGVPFNVLTEMVRLFSYDVDFQRDIRPGDSFALMYEQDITDDGRPVRTRAIHLARMTLRGKPLKFYAHLHEDGEFEHYNEKGEGVRKALMRTPVNGARLTSNFGSRKHPILGYTRMHKGVDFGAPTGTPVMAAGDGIIKKRARWGSYGNYVRIRHGSNYETAYGHLSRYARGIKTGSRVKQGEIIGYVGMTGGATGPHLHYEILLNNKQVNPMTIKFPASRKLNGVQLAQFQKTRLEIERKFAALDTSSDLAVVRPGVSKKFQK
ncbi:MAG: peptidase M23 [Candidatus Marinimicrobia bacterium]|nr:peptidase M23 [Candidatus Neomarinimicrobiota bacterium]